jgi:uncharacterized membrane protein YkvA (DUF1232 family)
MLIVAVLLAARLVVVFFGGLSSQGWAQAIVSITNYLVIPFGIHPIKTPYGGYFDVNAAATVVIILVAETFLSTVRDRA